MTNIETIERDPVLAAIADYRQADSEFIRCCELEEAQGGHATATYAAADASGDARETLLTTTPTTAEGLVAVLHLVGNSDVLATTDEAQVFIHTIKSAVLSLLERRL